VLIPRTFRARRGTIVLALAVAAACGADPVLPPDTVLPDLPNTVGADAILLRLPARGGLATAYQWPRVDSVLWTAADPLPPLRSLLAFDGAGGIVAVQDTAGRAGRLDLRTGRVAAGEQVLASAASADGWSTVGLVEGRLHRWTPSGLWRGPSERADEVLPLPNGDVILVRHSDADSRLLRVRPPSSAIVDSVVVPRIMRATRTTNGDRWYLESAEGVIAVESRSFARGEAPPEDSPRALVVSPSGDRVITLSADGSDLRIWDRYADRTLAKLALAASAVDLRMDPLGRFVLIQREGVDSILVLSLPLAAPIGVIPSTWQADLPAVTPDGSILTREGADVVVRAPQTGAERARIRGGAVDLWTIVRWDGFRPRDRSLDAPVTFASLSPADSAAEAEAIDSLLAISAREALDAGGESLRDLARASDVPPPVDDSAAAAAGYTLAFASLLSESRARALAERIRVDGRSPRVVVSSREGVSIFRVVIGPFPTRDAAEAAGRRSGVSFWVFAGLP
jgi:cell division septation protein DedD